MCNNTNDAEFLTDGSLDAYNSFVGLLSNIYDI